MTLNFWKAEKLRLSDRFFNLLHARGMLIAVVEFPVSKAYVEMGNLRAEKPRRSC